MVMIAVSYQKLLVSLENIDTLTPALLGYP